MKHIAIFCVVYNSYKELFAYLESIDNATFYAKDCSVDVYVADNTDNDFKDFTVDKYNYINVKVYPFHQNLGYFGAIKKMMEKEEYTKYDYIIISNVDMTLRQNTLQVLINNSYPTDTGWIASSIISKRTGLDMNPRVINRYSAKKLEIMKWLYKHPLAYQFYLYTFHKLKQSRISTFEPGFIYAGHGSFIILTKEYFFKCGIIDYPVFLYCEEIYIAEKCLRNNLKVIYDTSIRVDDIGRISTGKAPQSTYYKWNIEGLTYILDKYYK